MIGASSSRLDWDETQLLQHAILPFEGDERVECGENGPSVKWRILTPRQRQRPEAQPEKDAQFLNTLALAPAPQDAAGILSHIYDHSFSVNETTEISLTESEDDSTFFDESVAINASQVRVQPDGQTPASSFPSSFKEKVYDLRDIPSAAYLNSIIPQVMTTHLIVAVLEVRGPRRITGRIFQQELDMIELVVADETRTGFGVTFWLPLSVKPGTMAAQHAEMLRRKLSSLRPRDIVFLRTVALRAFRGRVYGQSLRRDLTKIDLLHRHALDATDAEGMYSLDAILAARDESPILKKVRRVREWLVAFVAPVVHRGDCTLPLPPDTQE